MQQSGSVQITSMSADVNLLHYIIETLVIHRMEIFMFVSAMLGYALLVSSRRTLGAAIGEGKKPLKVMQAQPAEGVGTSDATSGYGYEAASEDHLCHIVEALHSQGSTPEFIANALLGFFQRHPERRVMSDVNELLDYIGQKADCELMGLIVDMLPSMGLKPDQHTCEICLKAYAAERNFAAARRLISMMAAEEIPLSARAAFVAMKVELLAGNFDETMKHFRVLRRSWVAQKSSDPVVSQSMMSLIVELAWKEQKVRPLLAELKGVVMPEKSIEMLLVKCVEANDGDLAKAVEALARAQCTVLPNSVYSLLIKGRWKADAIVEEVLSLQRSEFSPDLALSIIEFCGGVSDAARVDRLFELMKPKQLHILAEFIRFYIGVENFERACDIFELDMQQAHGHAQGAALFNDAALEESVIDAAVVCGRINLAQGILALSKGRSVGCFGMIERHVREFLERVIHAIVMWHAVVEHWVVLVF